MGAPPNHPFLDRILHEINQPAIGDPPFNGPPPIFVVFDLIYPHHDPMFEPGFRGSTLKGSWFRCAVHSEAEAHDLHERNLKDFVKDHVGAA